MNNLKVIITWMFLVWTTFQVNAHESNISKRQANNAPPPKELVCFYHSWNAGRRGIAKFSPLNMNPHMCTHIVYANGELDNEHGIRPLDPNIDIDQNGYTLFTGLKRWNKKLKTLLGIGGAIAGSARFSSLVTDETRRKAFPKLAVQFMRQHNFDGINLNWQLPTYFEKSRPTDKENYVLLAKELKEEFDKEAIQSGKPKLLLTMCIPGVVDYIDKGFDIAKLTSILDWMYLLTYDFHTSFESYVSHHTPLYPTENYPDYMDSRLTVNYTIHHLLRIGADRRKLIMGLPAYGRTYTLFNPDYSDLGSPADGQGEQAKYTIEKGLIAFFEVCSEVTRSKGWTTEQPNKDVMGPYAYRGNQWISFDDLDMIKLKTKYALDHDLGGILFMSMDMDDFRGTCYNRSYPLIETARELLINHEFKTREAAKIRGKPQSAIDAVRAQYMTTPEPPPTPDPEEDPLLTKARITRLIQELLQNSTSTNVNNLSEERVSNIANKVISSGGVTPAHRLPENVPSLLLGNSDNYERGKPSSSYTERPMETSPMPNLSASFPEYIKIEDIGNALQSSIDTLQPSTDKKGSSDKHDGSSSEPTKHNIIYMVNALPFTQPLNTNGIAGQKGGPKFPVYKGPPKSQLSNNAEQSKPIDNSDDKVRIKITYEGGNQEILVSIK